MNRRFWVMVICAAMAATALAQPPGNAGVAGRRGPGGAAGGGNVANPGQNAPAVNPIFAAIDADGDGVITAKELRKAVVALKKLDTNRDGNITLEEVNAQNPLSGAGAAGAGQGAIAQGPNNVGGANGFPGPGGPEQQKINQQLMQSDRNHDGKLSADELPQQMRGMLRSGDTNGDGALDAQELQAIAQRMSEQFRGGQQFPNGYNGRPLVGQGNGQGNQKRP